MHPNLQDTIAALSSAPPATTGGAARAILRITGPGAFAVARKLFQPDAGQPPWPETPKAEATDAGRRKTAQRPWRRIRGRVSWREYRLPACAYIMPAPRSYTRQDLTELHLPSLHVVLHDLLGQLQEAGARQAGPGEFTRRALLNGRLSLAQAEAVGALIRAHSADEARAWADLTVRPGRTPPARLREEVEELLTRLELGLDFSLEDVTLLPREELGSRLKTLLRKTHAAAQQHDEPEGLAWGGEPRVVLIGPTGAGKSTLLNALVGRDVALHSDQGHTTRDPVEALLELEPNLPLRLIDTAGLDLAGTGEELTRHAISRTSRAAATADIRLVVLERSSALERTQVLDGLSRHLSETIPAATALVWSKTDLPAVATAADARWLKDKIARLTGTGSIDVFEVAAPEGKGLDELRAFLKVHARKLLARVSSAWSAGVTAQTAGCRGAHTALTRADEALRSDLGEDAIAVELREAVHALSDAQGVFLRHDALTESLLDRIFSRFCVGK